MSSTDIATIKPTQLPTAQPATRPLQVRGKLAEAIALMVEKGQPYDEAGRTVGMTTRAMRKALDKPHVIAFIRARKQVFREAVSAKNILRLAEIRDAGNNMPAVNAIKELENLGNDENTNGRKHIATPPGLLIQVVGHVNVQPQPAPTPSNAHDT